MLQAMNTGHEGSLTTLHANTAEEAVSRLENLILMADQGLPIESTLFCSLSAMQTGRGKFWKLRKLAGLIRLQDGWRSIRYLPPSTITRTLAR